MSKNEERDIPSTNEELHDPMAQFLFGGKRKENETRIEEEQLKDTKEAPFHDRAFSADEWLFGKRDKEPLEPNKFNGLEEFSQINKLLNNINMEELVENIDTLMNTTSQLKPLWKKLTPLVNKWIK